MVRLPEKGRQRQCHSSGNSRDSYKRRLPKGKQNLDENTGHTSSRRGKHDLS
jgi:hypothetical protein